MHVIALSLNYRKASVEEREKLNFEDSEIVPALHTLRDQKSILEAVIFSTCNRTELYVVTDQIHTGTYYTRNFLSEHFNVSLDTIKDITEIKVNDDAIRHLYRVAAGLDSMVLGETQILGQIRDAFILAQEEHTTGKIFNKLFKEVITVAKRGHNETEISKHAVSMSYAAVELAKTIFENIKDLKVLVLGAGEMSEESLLNLTSNSVSDVTVVNRNPDNARTLAEKYLGNYRPLNELEDALKDTDIVISSTGAPDFIITEDMIEKIKGNNEERPLILIDIAVPRDIDPNVSHIDNVYYYNVDDLSGIVDGNLEKRKEEAKKIESMIDQSTAEYLNWVEMQGVLPVIEAMRTKALNIHESTFNSINNKLDLSKREKTIISKHMKSIINQMLRDPITYTKELADERKGAVQLTELEHIFGIEQIVEDIHKRHNEEYKRREQLRREKQPIRK